MKPSVLMICQDPRGYVWRPMAGPWPYHIHISRELLLGLTQEDSIVRLNEGAVEFHCTKEIVTYALGDYIASEEAFEADLFDFETR